MERANIISLLGFKIEKTFEGKSFGDSVTIYTSSDLRLRIVKDKGQEFVEISSQQYPEDWFDMSIIQDWVMKYGDDQKNIGLEGGFSFLQTHFTEIRNAFQPHMVSKTRKDLKILSEDRVRHRFPKLY